MNTITKQIISIFLVSIIFVHFSFLIISENPLKLQQGKLFALSDRYIYPFFFQSWNVFVPTPKTKNEIYIKLNSESQWHILFPVNYTANYKKVVFGNDAISLLFSNSLAYAIYEIQNKTLNNSNNSAYSILNFSVKKHITLKFNVTKNDIYNLLIVTTKNNVKKTYLFKNITL